jgi:hypothetical protein
MIHQKKHLKNSANYEKDGSPGETVAAKKVQVIQCT